MNKRLKFFISILLVFAISVSIFCVPASSFENDVETSTSAILLVNTDTNTVVYSQMPDSKWYAGYLSELTTFLVANDMLSSPEEAEIQIEQSYINALPYSDGCLKPFIGETLTARDLMAIMLLTSGSDAAYVLAYIASNGDLTSFVDAMNEKAEELGCTTTHYLTPGYDSSGDHYTNCRDLYKIYMEVMKNSFYRQVMEDSSYTPPSLVDDDSEDEEKERFTVTSEASILNDSSPYYFRYVKGAKYSYSESTYACLALTTTYRGKSYFFVGLRGLTENEKNVYADARKLTTWAYLNLSDRKMLIAEEAMTSTTVTTGWGSYHIDLHPFNSAFKTLPNDYDEEKLSYTFDVPKTVEAPLYINQTVGRAKMTYDGEEIDDVELIVNSDEGLDMVADFGRFSGFVYSRLMPRQPVVEKDAGEIKATED